VGEIKRVTSAMPCGASPKDAMRIISVHCLVAAVVMGIVGARAPVVTTFSLILCRTVSSLMSARNVLVLGVLVLVGVLLLLAVLVLLVVARNPPL
jgi:hypothetical protein